MACSIAFLMTRECFTTLIRAIFFSRHRQNFSAVKKIPSQKWYVIHLTVFAFETKSGIEKLLRQVSE